MDGRLKDEALQFQIRVLSVFPDFNTLVISDIGIFGLRWLGFDFLPTEESPRPQCSRKRAQIKKGTHSAARADRQRRSFYVNDMPHVT